MKSKWKAYYQYIKTVVPEKWSQLNCPYDMYSSMKIARERLKDRDFNADGGINFIMAVPINNWEVELIQGASKFGTCHHVDFEPRGFFESKKKWELWRVDNFSHLKSKVQLAYDEKKINILFLYLTEFHIDSTRLKELHQDNLIIVGFNWDDRLHFSSTHKGQIVGVKEIAKNVDFSLTMSVNSLSRYANNSNSVFYWEGLKEKITKDIVLPKIKFNKVLFFGSRYGYREDMIEYLVKKDLPMELYGEGWGSNYISYEDLTYKIPRHSLNLGISTIGYTKKLTCVKGRDIEVPSVGGLYITNRGSEVEQLYTEDKNILLYGSMDECYRKASKVLDNPDKFSHIRKNGTLKAREFSWENRFDYLIQLVNRVIFND